MKTTILSGALAMMLTQGAAAAPGDLPSREEMWEIIQKQQKQIESLSKTATTNAARIEESEEVFSSLESSSGGHGGANWFKDTTIGGYAELQFSQGSTGEGNSDSDQFDASRFVLALQHEFDEDIRGVFEIEFEHGGDEVFIEQGFLEFDFNDYNRAKVGVVIAPIGILNEKHEPTTFFGTERNPVETAIIPTDYFVGGVFLNGELGDGFSYDAGVHTGLSVDTSTFAIRGGRQKAQRATAEDGAITGRIKYTGVAGLELATSVQYQQDITQGTGTDNASAVLLASHIDYRTGPWGLRALGAYWDVDGSQAEALGADEQYGFYIEPSYRFPIFEESEAGVFARYNLLDTNAGDNIDSQIQQIDVGANFWPHPDVVLKADVSFIDDEDGPDDQRINLGAGYVF